MANFSVLLAKYGASGDVRKICQIDVCVNFVNTQGVVVRVFPFLAAFLQSPPPRPLSLRDIPLTVPRGGDREENFAVVL